MITADELAKAITPDKKPLEVKFGRIDANYTTGKPRVLFDTSIGPGGGTPGEKPYPYLSSYTPAANDRVMLIQGVIMGKIIT